MSRKKLLILDLDQTIIDSSIRENYCYPDGSLCLETYKTVKTCPDKGIVNDVLLPFGLWLKDHFLVLSNMFDIVFLTARQVNEYDLSSFDALGLTPIFNDFRARIITRADVVHYNGNPLEQDSGIYKQAVIRTLETCGNYGHVVVVDDCIKVLNMARENNYSAICARDLYHFKRSDFVELFNSLAKI